MSLPTGRDLGLVVIGDGQVALVADGPLGEALVYRRSQAGDALLTAIGGARLGLEVAFVTRIGTDSFTPWLLASWESEYLHLDYARQVGGRNAVALVGADSDGRQELVYREGAPASLDSGDVANVPWELVGHVYAPGSTSALGTEPHEAVKAAFAAARDKGAVTVHDPTLRNGLWPPGAEARAREAFDDLLPLTDILIIGAPFATGRLLARATAAEAAQAAQRRGVPRVVVRLGGRRGCLVADRDEVTVIDGVDPPEVRRSGWGAEAAFNAGLVAGLARDQPLAGAAEAGLEAMALAVAAGADLDALPYLDQLNRFRTKRGGEALA